jgi:antitoxin (DNA-binding transcriptional repressor) of toxin-antitoxin stability system
MTQAGTPAWSASPASADARSESVNVYEAKIPLWQLPDRAAAGEEIVIERAGRAVARLVALAEPSRPRPPGGWRGKASMAADFDELPDEIDAAFRGERP